MKLKRVVSGIQPTGILHVGNYFGAVKNWIKLSENSSNQCFYFIADHHSVTNKYCGIEARKQDEKEEKSQNQEYGSKLTVIQTASCLLASGLDPKKVCLFAQSNVPAHAEFMWILSCMSPLSWLNNMIQFKEKTKNKDHALSSTGLYTYPILMAADILIYRAEEVPVGEDQTQHVELTRDLAARLNKFLQNEKIHFPQPNYSVNPERIMSLQNGLNKMSKSDRNTHSCLSLITTEEEIKNKILKAKTDSIGNVTYDEKKRPDVSNLINIYANSSGLSIKEVEEKFSSASTYEFKIELIKILCELLLPISYKAKLLIEKDFDYVRDVLREGRKAAIIESEKNLNDVKSCLNYFL